MTRHLSFRSGNPALSKNSFKRIDSDIQKGPVIRNELMTIKGTVDKTAISLLLMIGSGYYVYTEQIVSLILPGCFLGLAVAILTIFKKQYAPITVPIYALFQGLFLGGVSFMYGQMFEGIVYNAVLLTITILLSLLLAYRSGLIKPTENFKLGIFAATGGIALFYVISFVASFFGGGLAIFDPTNGSMTSILVSLFIVIIASLNLVLDFDFIEEASENGAPKYMEWYGAFGLLVTLVWLYLEILRLLAKINSRD
ncbi:MAG: Bax inhibitor-1/YccA family protein [Flavobacteriaceae bacterium]|nr:Bax inhibitor-1/YccA family protein [Flavobacteriaceae bacterium]MBL6678697.1 Bax inhibitor-1/YccA family protein [Flavobacteriaceae bacterium]